MFCKYHTSSRYLTILEILDTVHRYGDLDGSINFSGFVP
jgi:hypothetical protein